MGCCFSNDNDKDSQADEDNERARLLGNPVSNTSSRIPQAEGYGDHSYGGSVKKGDEQSALNRILQQTATNVIDVAALDTHTLEQMECTNRAKQYTQKLSSKVSSSRSGQYVYNKPSLLVDMSPVISNASALDKLLGTESFTFADIDLINEVSEQVADAFSKLRIEHEEDLVVHLGLQ